MLYYIVYETIGADKFIRMSTPRRAEAVAMAAFADHDYTHWDERESGACPGPSDTAWTDSRTKQQKRSAAYEMELEPLKNAWTGQTMMDGATNETALTGTLTFTTGSTEVTGIGTRFTSELADKCYIQFNKDKQPYCIASIKDDLKLVLTEKYNEHGGSGAASRTLLEKAEAQKKRDEIKAKYA